jgi:hypothetical protein
MRRFLSVMAFCLFSFPLTLGSGAFRLVYASQERAGGGTALDSLPLSDVVGVARLSPDKPGTFQGSKIDQGLQFMTHDTGIDSTVKVHLGGGYAMLNGTIYVEPSPYPVLLTVQDVSNPATGVKQLFQSSVEPSAQASFALDVHGVQDISLIVHKNGGNCCDNETADVVASLTGTPPSYVKALYPTTNVVIPPATSVTFLWNGYPGSTAYMISIWLVRQSGSRVITPQTRIATTKIIFGATSYIWNDSGFFPGKYRYDIMPIDRYGNAVAGRSRVIQFSIAG